MNKIEDNNSQESNNSLTSNSDTQDFISSDEEIKSGAHQKFIGNKFLGCNINENGKRCKKRSTKKEMYEVERKEIIKEILETIKINEENKTFILHDIENSLELKNKINELEERIKKYYKTGNWNFYIQRNNGDTSPIIGLLRTLLRENDIDLTKKDISLQLDGKKIRTTKYYLMM